MWRDETPLTAEEILAPIVKENPDVYFDEESLSACERYLEDNSNYICLIMPVKVQ